MKFDQMSEMEEDAGYVQPPQLPVSIIDVDRNVECFAMHLPMQDPCPRCGGFRMQVGDYVCWGFCYACYLAAKKKGIP